MVSISVFPLYSQQSGKFITISSYYIKKAPSFLVMTTTEFLYQRCRCCLMHQSLLSFPFFHPCHLTLLYASLANKSFVNYYHTQQWQTLIYKDREEGATAIETADQNEGIVHCSRCIVITLRPSQEIAAMKLANKPPYECLREDDSHLRPMLAVSERKEEKENTVHTSKQ